MSRVSVQGAPDTMQTLGAKTANELGLKVLYVDINSCFATIEQQARPKLRGKPVAITNRLVEHSTIIAASIEAKKLGVKVGMRIEEARGICPDIIATETEPSKYIFVHQKLKQVMAKYSPVIQMKSIDEGLISLVESPVEFQNMPIENLARNFKSDIARELGNYIKINLGFGQNRFFAKLAGELHKPNGCDVIVPGNVREVFGNLELVDLPGINRQMKKRLNTYQINTPVDLLDAKLETLEKQVCHSVEGVKWYKRLRGEEVDEREDATKSVGRQFVLPPNCPQENVELFLAHLAEEAAARMRSQGLMAKGLQVWRSAEKQNGKGLPSGFGASTHAAKVSQITTTAFSSDRDTIHLALKLYKKLPKNNGRIIGVTLYKLQKDPDSQLSIFQSELDHQRKIADLTDAINDRFGQRTIHSAVTTGTDIVKTKIPFGSTKYFK